MEAFEKVLINWVNCLKFAEPIQDLDDLKNGIFLHNLQKIISRKNLPCVGTDTLTFLFKLLELHYPKFMIDNKSNIHLNDLPHETLLCVVSLVLHYICIYDRRPVLASPLCTELDTPSQLAIKNFLEKIADCSEIDNDTLIRVINSSVESEKTEESQKESPLQLLLKTPVPKANRLIKRDQEITGLLTEVELLQEEKERLEADLKAERGKNKTLGKQLNKKNEEISQLRCEVLTLEGRTPPNFQDADLRESQKILRTKVETLEEIIKQNYKDYDELTDKREEDRAQLKNLESQCNMWLTKFIDSNNQLHVLSEICEGQEIKLQNFEKHCNELEALLEEMKSKSVHESFMEESFKSTEVRNYQVPNSDSFLGSEDLAHSVVDLQLKEQQHENTLLKSALQNAENVNEILTAEKNELHNELLIKEAHLQKMSEDLEKVMVVYSEMFRKQKGLNSEGKAREVCTNEENVSVEIETLCSDVINMTNNFEAALLENNTVINNLKLEICKLGQKCQEITNHNEFLAVQCSDLRESLSAAEKQKEESEEDFQKSESELELAIRNIEVNKHKLKEATETNNILNLQCSNLMIRLSVVMNQKEQLIEDFQKSETDLEIAINDKQVALANYAKSIAIVNLFFHNYRNLLIFAYLLHVANNILNTRISELLRRVYQLANDRQLLLEQATEHYKNIATLEYLNNRLQECLSFANEEKKKIEYRCNQIEDNFFHVKVAYENFKRLSEERASSHEQKTMAISDSLESTLKQLETCSLEKEALTESIESFKQQVDKLSEENKTLRFSLEEAQTEHQTMKAKQIAVIDRQTKTLQEKECTLSLYMEEKADISRLLEKLNNDKVVMQKEFVGNLKTIHDANLKVDILTRENLAISHSLESTLKQLETCSQEKEALTETVESFKKEIDKLSEENKILRSNLEETSTLFEENKLLRLSLEEAKTEQQIMKEKQLAVLDAQAAALHEAESTSSHPQTSDDMSNYIEQQENEKAIMQKELDKNLKEVNEAYSNVDRLKREKLEISHSLDSTLKQLETCSQEKETLTETVESFKKEIDKLSEENKTLRSNLEEASTLSEENKLLRLSLEEAKTEQQIMKEKQLAIVDAQAAALHVAESTSSHLQASDDLSNYIEKQENEKAIMQKELDKNLKEVNEAYSNVDRLMREKLEISHSLESTSKQLETDSLEKVALTETVESFKWEIDKLSEENKTLRFLLEEAKTDYQKSKVNQFAMETQAEALQKAECLVSHSPEHPPQLKSHMFDPIDRLEAEKVNMQKEFKKNLKKTQEAYSKIVSVNFTLETENANIKKKIKCLNRQLEEHAQIKEAYEKLLEENSKLQTERDTVKYKRLRDREEFMKMIRKEREDIEAMASKKIKEIRHDYEVKAEMMREQMLKLYNDEVKKEIQKVNQEGGKSHNIYQKQTEELRKQLSEAKYKIRMLELDHELGDQRASRNIRSSRESLVSLPERSSSSFYLNQPEMVSKPHSGQLTRKINISTMRSNNSSRRASTLPRSQFAEIKETDGITRQSSVGAHANIGNLEMEDEDDDFNNKYLMDLKAGRCVVKDTGRKSDASRVSELAWRNSLMPPHLKSSYPVEAQFYSPSKFKEDDLKAGNIDLDNSQSKLLPSEKSRQKKDFGTTSYRKPGPPTPSKNARLSQQSNEIQPLREQNERTPKRLTPSRIRMMFTGKSSSSQAKNNTENQTDTPKTQKRLSLFRKQK